jgi:quinol---cytochrome c reductase iron-sulfur subunit, bacillus type
MVENHNQPEDPAETATEPSVADPSRRKFLVYTIVGIGGGITVALAIPAVAFVAGSARTPAGEHTWIPLGSASSIEPGAGPTLKKVTVERSSGDLVEEQEISVFVETNDGVQFTVLSNVCTHLGCRVRWVGEQSEFFCPCHGAVFAEDGAVVSGPPPRPLDRYASKVEDGQLFMKEA